MDGVYKLNRAAKHITEHKTVVDDASDKALMRAYGIIGPPAILFFDREGKEMKAWRLVGETSS